MSLHFFFGDSKMTLNVKGYAAFAAQEEAGTGAVL
jgi:hypothetical protein